MVILITGARGFIGRHVAAALRNAGHTVIEARRDAAPDAVEARAADFTRDLHARDWLPKLAGVDVVINTVGILREAGEQSFERVHTRAPQALFEACVEARVRRVIQFSALGAERGTTGYFRSKHAADERLRSLPIDWTIVQPSLVYGPGGTSARLFTMMASLPVITLPGRGDQQVQPIHIDDLTAAIVRVLASDIASRRRVALVGPRALTFREMLARLRASLGLRPALFLPVPKLLMQIGAHVLALSRRSLLDPDTLSMLQSHNTADPAATKQLLGREPRDIEEFIEPRSREATLTGALLTWLLPLLRVSIAAVWIWTGIVSLGVYPASRSYELLARVGVPSALAPMMLYGAAALDLLLGLGTLVLPRRRALWLAQIALIVSYTILITWRLPEFWLHPYGPILKNLPMLAAIYLLYQLEARR